MSNATNIIADLTMENRMLQRRHREMQEHAGRQLAQIRFYRETLVNLLKINVGLPGGDDQFGTKAFMEKYGIELNNHGAPNNILTFALNLDPKDLPEQS
jgi:hypothetical protein